MAIFRFLSLSPGEMCPMFLDVCIGLLINALSVTNVVRQQSERDCGLQYMALDLNILVLVSDGGFWEHDNQQRVELLY